jgi:sugar lactone lactonase YvrE
MNRNNWLWTWLLIPFLGAGPALGDEGATQGEGERIASIEGLAGPEAVHWDAEQKLWFISNFNGDAAGDANGFISKASADGELLALEFMVGTEAHPLHGPRGMRIRGERLWVADAEGLHAFDRFSGDHLEFMDFSAFEPGFLNDVEIGPEGALYLTDTSNARLFRVARGEISIVASEELTSPPNGVLWLPDSEALVLAPWGGGLTFDVYRPAQGDLATGPTLPAGGNIDGLEAWQGGFLAASQVDQAIWFVLEDQAEMLIRTPGRPADIGLDPAGGRVAVPYIALDRVDIWQLPADD